MQDQYVLLEALVRSLTDAVATFDRAMPYITRGALRTDSEVERDRLETMIDRLLAEYGGNALRDDGPERRRFTSLTALEQKERTRLGA